MLTVRVGLSKSEEASRRSSGRAVPAPRAVLAMIDTGSGRSILQRELVVEMGLASVGRVEIDTPSSTDLSAGEYLVRLWFGDEMPIEVKVLEAPLPVPRLQVLLGRDVLSHGRFCYDGPANAFTLDLGGRADQQPLD